MDIFTLFSFCIRKSTQTLLWPIYMNNAIRNVHYSSMQIKWDILQDPLSLSQYCFDCNNIGQTCSQIRVCHLLREGVGVGLFLKKFWCSSNRMFSDTINRLFRFQLIYQVFNWLKFLHCKCLQKKFNKKKVLILLKSFYKMCN